MHIGQVLLNIRLFQAEEAKLGWGKLPLFRTGPTSEQPTFKCKICLNSTNRTSRSQLNHSQKPCEWFGHNLQVLLVKLEQILRLKVDCSDFAFGFPVRDRGGLPYLSSCSTYLCHLSHASTLLIMGLTEVIISKMAYKFGTNNFIFVRVR